MLGSLIEKQLSTPDYYPMTQKALVAACNQKNARDPVTSYTEPEVVAALSLLQQKKIVIAVKSDTGYATRWRHELDRKWNIQGREAAVLAELLLRGPQTEGELRSRAGRMRPFPDPEALQETLASLRGMDPALVVRLSRDGAVRGVRYAHALYPEDEAEQVTESAGEPHSGGPHAGGAHESGPPPTDLSSLRSRVAELESRVARIERLLNDELGASLPATQGAPPPAEGDEA